ncbi:hypothetical protein [Paraburkholderia sp. UYCP14C]|uniref:hypothetical protein n=1 Tax=Paraburkholderia sp. UYCP14C TaxID=2511130 RepID=UPI001459FF9F|nr:hypothetical protein [Paraburkholderia sp. UYCP14C]
MQGQRRRAIVKQQGWTSKNDIGVRATRYRRDIRWRGMPSRGHNDLKQTFAIVTAEMPHCEVRGADRSAFRGDSLQQAVVIRASSTNARTAFGRGRI